MAIRNDDRRSRQARDASSRDGSVRPTSRSTRNQQSSARSARSQRTSASQNHRRADTQRYADDPRSSQNRRSATRGQRTTSRLSRKQRADQTRTAATRTSTPDPYTRWTDPRSAELRGGAPRQAAQRASVNNAQQTQAAQANRGATSTRTAAQREAIARIPQIKVIPTGAQQQAQPAQEADQQPQLQSTRIGTIRRAERAERLRKSSRRYLLRIILIIGVIVALLAGWAALYNSPVFTIEEVKVNGVEHLTSEEMAQLANVPMDSTLLRVDTDVIASRIKKNSWVADVQINRVFPNTLEINVTERPIKAIVEITSGSGGSVKQWAIAEDHTWLMPIPEQGSEAAKTTSAKIYEDAAKALHIKDVPYGTKAEIGEVCTDNNVNNALDIIAGMTTDLSGRVVEVSAAGPAETTLMLDDGVEIAFGKAEDIRDKERVILKILEENPDGVAYINVRMVETPTWRAI